LAVTSDAKQFAAAIVLVDDRLELLEPANLAVALRRAGKRGGGNDEQQQTDQDSHCGHLSEIETNATAGAIAPLFQGLCGCDYWYLASRSSSSIEMPCGLRMKQMRTPGRIVTGS